MFDKAQDYGPSLPPHDHEDPSIIEDFEKREVIEKSANFRGNWSMLFLERLQNPLIERRYIVTKLLDKDIREDDPNYLAVRLRYRDRLSEVFGRTYYGKSNELNDLSISQASPEKAGSITYTEHQPIVYSDAVNPNGRPLGVYEKSIVEAHEQAHAMFNDMSKVQRDYIYKLLSQEFLHLFTDKRLAAEEFMAKITQFKNYFGMKSAEEFTKQHLDYLRLHYVTDTGFDNSVSTLLKSIDNEKEPFFISLMNEIAC